MFPTINKRDRALRVRTFDPARPPGAQRLAAAHEGVTSPCFCSRYLGRRARRGGTGPWVTLPRSSGLNPGEVSRPPSGSVSSEPPQLEPRPARGDQITRGHVRDVPEHHVRAVDALPG